MNQHTQHQSTRVRATATGRTWLLSTGHRAGANEDLRCKFASVLTHENKTVKTDT